MLLVSDKKILVLQVQKWHREEDELLRSERDRMLRDAEWEAESIPRRLEQLHREKAVLATMVRGHDVFYTDVTMRDAACYSRQQHDSLNRRVRLSAYADRVWAAFFDGKRRNRQKLKDATDRLHQRQREALGDTDTPFLQSLRRFSKVVEASLRKFASSLAWGEFACAPFFTSSGDPEADQPPPPKSYFIVLTDDPAVLVPYSRPPAENLEALSIATLPPECCVVAQTFPAGSYGTIFKSGPGHILLPTAPSLCEMDMCRLEVLQLAASFYVVRVQTFYV